MEKKIRIMVVDDHALFRAGMASLLPSLSDHFEVMATAADGEDMVGQLQLCGTLPDIILLDIKMPRMDGFGAAAILQHRFPTIKVIVVTMHDREEFLVQLLRKGVKGFISKTAEAQEMRLAIESIVSKGYHITDAVGSTLFELAGAQHEGVADSLNDKELWFLQLAATELTYQEIATKMGISARSVEGLRVNLFEKLGVKSRVGLVMFAVREGLVGR